MLYTKIQPQRFLSPREEVSLLPCMGMANVGKKVSGKKVSGKKVSEKKNPEKKYQEKK